MWPTHIFVPLGLLYDTQRRGLKTLSAQFLREMNTLGLLHDSQLVFFSHIDDYLTYLADYSLLEAAFPGISVWPWQLCLHSMSTVVLLIDYDKERIASARQKGVYTYEVPRRSSVAFNRNLFADSMTAYAFYHAA